MITLTDGTPLRVETGEFSLLAGNPRNIGDVALLRTAWCELVTVALLPDSTGRLWFVCTRREVAPYCRPKAVIRKYLTPKRRARLVAKALRLKKELAEVMEMLGRRSL